ncbi:hypothetical protein SeMB42_g05314 [Synchytrium endobioticum]|uniref:Uncharacterized protein n=1 Tax=Synchytrium endobioticum TaxID=286115 RepID=A0A507CS83_9FUNG|nr:hypothetical protein SeMB42_g05314 [Synchytrium endobioticum]
MDSRMRILQKCPCCGRDVLAAENMVNILLSCLHTGPKEYLFPPEKTYAQEESRNSIGRLKTRDKFTQFL